jgi:Protein of unknown function (DUF3606)
MADDLHLKGPQDRTRISLTEPWEVRYWTKALGVSKEELERPVKEHGHCVKKIREVLGKAPA